MSDEQPESATSAVVLGAAGGIGRALVARLAADGAHVVAVDRDARVADLPDCTPLAGDATDPDLIERAFAACVHPPRILVHALLDEVRSPLGELTLADWRRVLDIGLVSAWQAAAALVRHKGPGPAAVVLIGSVHAHAAAPGVAPYAVAKAGLAALARAAAVEWGPLGVRTNVLEPGFVTVPRNEHRWSDPAERATILAAYPLGRLCAPEEIAGAASFLASDQASYINGACIPVDGGALAVLPETLVPRPTPPNASGTSGPPLPPGASGP
ncbi:SDR family NAD(P)-dependent oxidoreductase [Streptomyces sp. NBC_01304]|uniref:SDR family NAD(P)-dependent oxidoreductase n=1 Tax=Streptomyces sp. NBC_01304 TaxID=2903818 RepID=UPI002E0F105A|nr:SDR family oxidoreductase [Streptomyces sp. NBC_01304]